MPSASLALSLSDGKPSAVCADMRRLSCGCSRPLRAPLEAIDVPRQKLTLPPVEQAQREIDAEIQQAIRMLAAEVGPAPGARPLSEAKKVSMWGQRDPKVDYTQVASQLMTTGLAPDLLDPEKGLALFKEHPEMAQMYAQPVAPDVADQLARLAEYPLRLGLLAHLEDYPKQNVAEANRLDRAWEKQTGGTEEPPPADQGQDVATGVYTRPPGQVTLTDATTAPPSDTAGAAAPTPYPSQMGG